MKTVLIELLALVIGAAIVPLGVVVTLVLLRGRAGRIRATAFTAGGMVAQLLQGLVFGYLLRGVAAKPGDRGDWIGPTLLLLAAVVLLGKLLLMWRGGPKVGVSSKLMAMLGEVSALSAFGIGALLALIAVNQWPFFVSAVAVIDEGQLGWARSVVAYLCFVIAANSLLLAPVVIAAIAPVPARTLLDAAHCWMERNNRAIAMIVSLTFGVWFLWKGIAGLMADRNAPVVAMISALSLRPHQV
jgi:hypothetical protein